MERICDRMNMIKACESVLSTREPTPEVLAECRELGQKIAKLEKVERVPKTEEPRL